jgi:hypothetical protein
LSIFYFHTLQQQSTGILMSQLNNFVKLALPLCFALLFTVKGISQPFVDVFQLRYMNAFGNNSSEISQVGHLWAGSDLPIKLREKTYILFSPYYEQWRLDSAGQKDRYPTLQSLAFPLGILFPIGNSKWSAMVLPIARWNGKRLFDDHTFQFGAATVAIYERKPKQKFRAGVYVNGEFFGLFIVPLLGVDWKINDKNYVFGNLPGRLCFEHKLNQKFYSGVNFRSFTNSFRLPGTEYLKLSDNQVSAFLDYYFTKRICLTLEPGFGLIRKIKIGTDDEGYIGEKEWSNGPFVRVSAAYRLRL